MPHSLQGKTIAILATDGFEQIRTAATKTGSGAHWSENESRVSQRGKIKGWNMKNWGNEVPVDMELKSAKPDQFELSSDRAVS